MINLYERMLPIPAGIEHTPPDHQSDTHLIELLRPVQTFELSLNVHCTSKSSNSTDQTADVDDDLTFPLLKLLCKAISNGSEQTAKPFHTAQTSMARTSLGPWKFVRGMGSSRH